MFGCFSLIFYGIVELGVVIVIGNLERSEWDLEILTPTPHSDFKS